MSSKRKIFGAIVLLSVAAVVTVLATHKGGKDENSALAELVDMNNKGLDFGKFSGKVVFVNNWATWCPPCIAEMPTIQTLKNKLKGENIVFIMVSFDDNREKAKSFLKKKGYDFEVFFPGENYPYATGSIPATFILDKTGKTVSRHVGMADYSSDELAGKLKELSRE